MPVLTPTTMTTIAMKPRRSTILQEAAATQTVMAMPLCLMAEGGGRTATREREESGFAMGMILAGPIGEETHHPREIHILLHTAVRRATPTLDPEVLPETPGEEERSH